ncbi:MAG: ABC transporter substrate-binding protein [Deltaproteobacteria bacterium]|nr:ABC transporter substrate-binding protein [Deltaproteobacteria bacterium]
MKNKLHDHAEIKSTPGWLGFLLLVLLLATLISCQGETPEGLLRIGLPEEPRTLNIWLASDANSRKILTQIYQPLYLRDPKTLKLVPWLAAEDPIYDEEKITYTVKLRQVKWADGSDFTADDVVFTGNVIKEFKVPRYSSKWKAIKKIETPDDYTVIFYLKKPTAVFLSRALTAPMVSRKEWEAVAAEAKTKDKPLRSLQNHRVERPLGTGPFVLKDYKGGAYLHMVRNPHFFGTGQRIGGHLLGPYIDGILFKFYGTSDVAILALKKGNIDMFWWGLQPGYLDDLTRDPDIAVFHNQKSALYYMGFNLRRPPFDDVVLRRAIATIIDKDFIISRILQGYGTILHSVVPPGNQFWHNPQVPHYGDGLNHEQRLKLAYDMLKAAGYSWTEPPVDPDGNVTKGKELHLPDGKPMERFTILTPPADYDPRRAFAGLMIQEWLRNMGLPAYARPMAFSALLQQVKGKRDFDAFILGYGSLNLDPDYVGTFFYSKQDKERGWNMSGYRNKTFDTLRNKQRGEMDRDKRREMLWEMQRILLEDVPYIPLYNPDVLEAARKDRCSGWVEKVGGIGSVWSFCTVKPIGS